MASIVERQTSFLSDKTIKYDRQLRLWQDWGQRDLENAKLCLINANATGTETLKNVILPGCGYFTIIDDSLVTEDDLSNNFFITAESVGQSRAKATCEYLRELNLDVIGNHLEDNVERILQCRPEFFKQFNIVIASNLLENSLKQLAEYLWSENIPLIILRSCGLVGSIRLVVREHTIIEAHPDNELPDLRLDVPFPELTEYCDAMDLNQMSKKDHSHVPYLVILYKCLEAWKSQNDGKIPSNYKEKEKFKELIRSGYFKNEHNMPEIEENFEEALKNVNNSITKTQIPSEIKRLFEDEKCLNINANSKPFWILMRALKEFVESEGAGLLPLRGSIPDMFSDSERFIGLQNIYRNKAQRDLEAITSRVEQLLYNIDKPYDYISEQQIKLFCKNAYFLKLIRGRSLNNEYDPQNSKLGILLEQDPEGDLIFYVLLRASSLFQIENNRFPGADGNQILDGDFVSLKKHAHALLSDYGSNYSLKDDYLHEICRYGNSELHSIAAFIGGCAAHETIKLLTSQFVPINNTFIYNAIKQTTTVYEL